MNKEIEQKRHLIYEYNRTVIDFPAQLEKVLETIPLFTRLTNGANKSVRKVKQLGYHILFYEYETPLQFELWLTNPDHIKNQRFPHSEVAEDLSLFLESQNIDPEKWLPYQGGTFLVNHKNNRYLQFNSEQLRDIKKYTDKKCLSLLCNKYHIKGIVGINTPFYINKQYEAYTQHQREENVLHEIARRNSMTVSEYLRFHIITTSAQNAPEIDASYFDSKTEKRKTIKAKIPVNPTHIAEEVKQFSIR